MKKRTIYFFIKTGKEKMKKTLKFILLFLTLSCSKNIDKNKQIVEEESIVTTEIANMTYDEISNNIIGHINDDNIRIRSNPNTNSEILGLLNMGDSVTVIDTSNEKVTINNYNNYWYKIITNDNITGWVFGGYIELINNEEPPEFAEMSWNSRFGNLARLENISINDLQSCSWRRYFTYIFFSKEGNYARTDRWDKAKYGRYIFKDNTVYFFPPIEIIRFDEYYTVNKLNYSNELHFEGAPVLRSDDETVVFVANDSEFVKTGETIRMYKYYCERIFEPGKVNRDGYLFTLPDKSSKNLFYDNYYGKKATEAVTAKLAKTKIDNITWYYTIFDFTSGDPIDGGGPFYEGWLSEDYFK